MSSSWWLIFGASLSVYTGIAVGSATRRIGWLTEEADQSLMRLVVRVLYPCLIFATVAKNAALRQPSNVLLPPLAAMVCMSLGFAVPWLVSRLGPRVTGLDTSPQRRTFAFCVGIYNYGFIPIPLITALFDDRTLGVLFVHNVGCELVLWTLGVMFLTGALGRRWWQQILNPPSVAIILALAFNLSGVYAGLPPFVDTALTLLGQAAIPLSLILIGATIADELQPRPGTNPRKQTAKTVAWALVLRLGLLPLAILLLAWLLPCSLELKRVLVVQASMPCGTFPIVMARHFGGDPRTGLQVVLSTSLASLLTIPLWIQTGLTLLGID